MIVVEDEGLWDFNADLYAAVLESLIKEFVLSSPSSATPLGAWMSLPLSP